MLSGFCCKSFEPFEGFLLRETRNAAGLPGERPAIGRVAASHSDRDTISA
jgi:hypothetical protein